VCGGVLLHDHGGEAPFREPNARECSSLSLCLILINIMVLGRGRRNEVNHGKSFGFLLFGGGGRFCYFTLMVLAYGFVKFWCIFVDEKEVEKSNHFFF